MISDSQNGNGTFSADVRLSLFVDDQQIDVASLGPGVGVLRDARSISATEGEIETIVDEQVTRWPIRITTKLDGSTKRFEFIGLE